MAYFIQTNRQAQTGEIRGLDLLKVVCKLGNVVRLDRDRWAHVLSHPEMRKQRYRIKETLVDPDEVRQSIRAAEVLLFYKLYAETPVTQKFMLVVVEILNGEGFIVTAFFTDKIKKGDLIWKKNQ
jgi:hypothetical protein